MKQNNKTQKRNVNVIIDINGNRIVLINTILFKGKRNVNWKDVEYYLKQFVGKSYVIRNTKETVRIGSDLPDEYSNSNYTHRLKGMSAKAKANAVQGLPEIIRIATDKEFEQNKKDKHKRDAKYGWYRYSSRFALPVLDESGNNIERYNVFHATLLMRHAKNNNIYLYDIMEIKKETSKLFQSKDLTQ